MEIALTEKTDKYNIKAVERCFDILDLFAQLDEPITIQTISTQLGINTNMAFRMLSTMVRAGYLEKDEMTGVYSISLKFLPLSRKALMSLEIRRVVMPFLEMLRTRYPNGNFNLAVLYQGDVIVIDRIDSVNLPRTYFTPGKTLPFHATGLGKVLTSELSEEELDAMIKKKGLKAFTPKTITTAEALKEELEKVRAQHYGTDRGEFIPGDNCNAFPLRDSTGEIIAAISIAAFDNYMSLEELEATIPVMAETARNISFFLGNNI